MQHKLFLSSLSRFFILLKKITNGRLVKKFEGRKFPFLEMRKSFFW